MNEEEIDAAYQILYLDDLSKKKETKTGHGNETSQSSGFRNCSRSNSLPLVQSVFRTLAKDQTRNRFEQKIRATYGKRAQNERKVKNCSRFIERCKRYDIEL